MQFKLEGKSDALTIEELKENLKALGALHSKVTILPEGNEPLDYIRFGLQQLVVSDIMNLLFDSGPLYPVKLNELRKQVLSTVDDLLSKVIVEVEHKVIEE